MNAPDRPSTSPPDAGSGKSPTPDRRLRGSLWTLALIVGVVWGGSHALNWWRQDQAARTVQRLAKPGDILMLTTATCPYCAKARAWMSARSVPWQECDVERDERCALLYQARGTPGVPLMNVKGQWNLGFNALWLSDAVAAP